MALTPPPMEIAWYAFRYALGRMTYAPEIVVEYLVKNHENISEENKSMILNDIENYLESCPDCHQADSWKKILHLYDEHFHVLVKRKSGAVISAILMDGKYYSPDYCHVYSNVKKVPGTWKKPNLPEKSTN